MRSAPRTRSGRGSPSSAPALGAPACPPRGRAISVAWLAREAHDAARERWPGWSAGLRHDASFEQLAARIERHLRARRADGDGPMTIVTNDLDAYAKWCEAAGSAPDDRRSRETDVDEARRGR